MTPYFLFVVLPVGSRTVRGSDELFSGILLWTAIIAIPGIPGSIVLINKLAIASSRRYETNLRDVVWTEIVRGWEDLYYCHRCDGVFLPGRSSLVPKARMLDLLSSV
jgi:hypothetical protein